jgi:hypothetical protein
MNKVLGYTLLFRLLLTPILHYGKNNILATIFILIFLDIIDCNPIVIKMFPKNELKNAQYCSKNRTYSILDKTIDIIQYIYAIFLLKNNNTINKSQFNILSLFLIYRIVGLISFIFTNKSSLYIVFFDFIKEYLFLIYLFGNNISKQILIILIIIKIIYEYLMHQSHIFIDIYKKLFE